MAAGRQTSRQPVTNIHRLYQRKFIDNLPCKVSHLPHHLTSLQSNPGHGGFYERWVLTVVIVSWLGRRMVGQDDNEEDHNEGDDNRIVYSDENQNTIQNDNNSNKASVWSFCLPNETTPSLLIKRLEEEGEEARQGEIINYFPSSLSCPLLLSSHSSFFKLRKLRPPCSSSCSVAGLGWLFYKCFREVARMSLQAWDHRLSPSSVVLWWIKLIDYQSINQPERAAQYWDWGGKKCIMELAQPPAEFAPTLFI